MTMPRKFEVLITAQEAYPAFERLFLHAKTSVTAGFRIFDPWTTLRSPEAQSLGDQWFDLIVDTLNRGVTIDITLGDFDPIVGNDLHRLTWASLRALWAAAEASNNPHLLTARAAMHPARVGLLPRMLLWPRLVKELRETLTDSGETDDQHQHFLRSVPGLAPLVRRGGKRLLPKYLPPPSLVPVTQHQKLAVFDSKTLYVGGLDLNDRRYDTPDHNRPSEQTWHDVQVITDGPIAAEAEAHLRNFVDATQGARVPRPTHLLRTISMKRKLALPFLSPKAAVAEITQAHFDAIDRAERLIYMETQFFRDRRLAKRLVRRAKENPKLTLILILPAAPEEVAFEKPGTDAAYGEHLQSKCVAILRKGFGPRVFIGAPAQPRLASGTGRDVHYGAPLVYLHAKVSIFDQTSAIVSSANLNGRSFAWDTEVGVQTQTAEEARQVTQRCFEHWLGPDAPETFFDPATATMAWQQRAAENAALAPDQRNAFLLPYLAEPAEAIGKNLPGVPEEMV